MLSNIAQTIDELSPSDVEQLSQLLCLADQPQLRYWLDDQRRLISTFSTSLRRPKSALVRLTLHLPFAPEQAILCSAHKALNSLLIRRIFLQVSSECTVRIRRLRDHPDLTEETKNAVGRLRSLQALWMGENVFKNSIAKDGKWFGRFDRVESGCEACILSIIGGDKQSLCDLRASCAGRRRKRRPEPRLLKLIDGWIDWTGEGDQLRFASETVAREMRAIRKSIQFTRREKKYGKIQPRTPNRPRTLTHPSTIEVPAPAPIPTSLIRESPRAGNYDDCDDEDMGEGPTGGEEEADFAGSIISFYRDIMDTTSLLDKSLQSTSALVDERSVHPAFRDSINRTQNSERGQSRGPKTSFGLSNFSRASRRGERDNPSSSAVSDSEGQAAAYRKLVGIPEFEMEGRSTLEPEIVVSETNSAVDSLTVSANRLNIQNRSRVTSSLYSRTTHGEPNPSFEEVPPVPDIPFEWAQRQSLRNEWKS